MKPSLLFEHLIAKNNLSSEQMRKVIQSCILGQYNDTQIATFLALMRMKGETIEELIAAAEVMHQAAHHIELGNNLIDIVGTGGDGKNTFNVSTACSFVVAASGISVAKHGNRSVSSRSGSADLLEHAGFILDLTEKQVKTCMQQCGLAFLFGPNFHPAMQHARAARQHLGIRTLFNLLGPLINPAGVKKQVVGVFSPIWQKPVASILSHFGSKRFLVVSSLDGLDEISIASPTKVLEYRNERLHQWLLNPKDYGMNHHSLDEIIVGSPSESLKLIKTVFSGKPGAARDIILLNSAAAIYCAHSDLSFEAALDQAKMAIDNGKANQYFIQLQQLTQNLNKESAHE